MSHEGFMIDPVRLPGTPERAADSACLQVEKLQLELEKNNEMHRQILGAAGDGIFGLDANGLTTFVNPAAQAMLGYTADELMGKPQHAMIHHTFADGRTAPRETCLIYRALHDGHVHSCDTEVFWRKDGTSFPMAYTSTPIMRNGKPDGAVVVFQETSERKRREQAMLESRKLEAIGTLAAGIAHDFNNILASIIGFAELTTDDLTEGSSASHNVQQIINGCFRARDLVNRMLTFARQNPIEAGATNLAVEVREVLALLRSSLPPSVHLAFENGMRPVDANAAVTAMPAQIQQVVMNLCINASHAMHGKGVIGIRLDPAANIEDSPPERANDVCLTVTDTGTGMTPEVMARMFDPFFTTKEPGKGTGLGLSVVYGIVADMGGVIKVRSRIEGGDMGTVFRVFLPLTR